MKVLIISGAFPPMPSGESTNAIYLANRLADRGLDVHVLTTRGSVASDRPGVTVHPLMRDWSWSDAPRFRKFLRGARPDAILLLYIGWIYNYHFMMTFAPTEAKRLLPNVPFVTRFENAMGAEPDRTSLFARVGRKLKALRDRRGDVDYSYGTLLRDSDRIIVLSDFHRSALSSVYAGVAGKSELIPPPPNMRVCVDGDGSVRSRARELLGAKPNDFLIAYIGYVYSGKGLETLLKAFQLVAARKSGVRLVMIGGPIATQSGNPSTYMAEIQGLARELGIDQKVKWTGSYSWDNDDASSYLHAADACVLPFNSGVQLNNSSFASAVSHGLPTITTQGETSDVAHIDRDSVLLCPPKNPEAIAAAIEALIDDPELRKRLHLGALDLARKWFSWESATARTVSTLQ